ncbi:MAG: protein phosphatase 2C domain-containing protein, partial [Propionibacteriaceae bacterium]|nr:protein phosphatase 2C domain-containing protein [Propionibacteriaceae bacterium]
MLVVADGMGGAAAGDLASAVAVQQLRRADRGAEGQQVTGDEMLELLAGALHNANEKIADLAADDHSLEGMGTTVTAALFDGVQLGLVHIGDSRAYLLRDDEIHRLTHDHSWVQSLVDEGKLTADEAAYHPHRSLLLKVLNGQPAADPDTELVDIEAGDRLLFCSDGLCGLVEDDELEEALTDHEDLQDVLDVLIDAAHREGGVDNITIILADVVDVDDDAAAPAAGAPVGATLEHDGEDLAETEPDFKAPEE